MKKVVLFVCMLALGGCGLRFGLVNEPTASGREVSPSNVTVYRAASFVGWAIPMTFLIDSTEVYGLWMGQEYSFRLDPGEYIFGYYLGFNECRRYGQIEPGRDYRIKLAPTCIIERESVGPKRTIIDSYTIDLVNDELDFDSDRLKPAMKTALDDLARRVRASSGVEQMTIIGHTDGIGDAGYNHDLGQRRATASKRYLVSAGGLDPSHIRTESAGKSNPVATNETEEGRGRNRRIEIRAEL